MEVIRNNNVKDSVFRITGKIITDDEIKTINSYKDEIIPKFLDVLTEQRDIVIAQELVKAITVDLNMYKSMCDMMAEDLCIMGKFRTPESAIKCYKEIVKEQGK